jgi:histidine phosphotransferase ChpT
MERTRVDTVHADTGPDRDRALALAECLAARLCHDVSGLVATIAGTLEMALDDDMSGPTEASVLATQAASQLAARVRLYRAAWGGGDMNEDAVTTLAEGLPNGSRLRLTLAPDLADRLDAPGRRLLLCALLAATAGMPAGGGIAAEPAGAGFRLVLDGRRAAWPEAVAAYGADLAACIDGAEPHGLAAPMMALIAAGLGWRLHIDGLCLTARPGPG